MGSFFDRDVEGIKRFFKRRFRYEPDSWPTWQDVLAGEEEEDDEQQEGEIADGETEKQGETKKIEGKKRVRLDEAVEASGWKRDMQQQLEEVRLANVTGACR